MKNLEYDGIGIHVEIYFKDYKSSLDALKEAQKVIGREVLKLETCTGGNAHS